MRIITLLVMMFCAGIGSAAAVAQEATPAAGESLLATMGYPELAITVHDDRFELPAQVAAGRTLIVYENAGQESRHSFLLRLPEGVTPAALEATPEPGQEDAPPAWLLDSSFPGFPGETLPGERTYAVVDLTPGSYVLVDDFFSPFEVVPGAAGSPVALPEPDAAGVVSLFEYGFEFPETIAPGRQVWQVTNAGREPHELLLVWSPEPITPEQVLEMFTNESEDENATPTGGGPSFAEIEPVGGLGWLSPGQTAWTEVDLEPGTYIALCFVFDPATGMPHVAMGMIDVFSVE